MNWHLDPGIDWHTYAFPAACFAFPAVVFGWRITKRAVRRRRIRAKYGATELADRLIARRIWEGESIAQVVDSLGPPAAVDEKRTAYSVRHILKYHRTGRTRYGLRITIDNGRVTGWDMKRN